MAAMDDELRARIERASRGDTLASSELLAQNLPMLRRYFRLKAGRRVLSHESVSDLVQSVCAEVLEDLDGFEYRGEAQFRSWLVKHAWSKLSERIRYWKREKRDEARTRLASEEDPEGLELAKEFLTPSRVAIGREDVERFEVALGELGPEMRDAILLRRVVQLPYPEIAAVLDKSEGAVRNLVYRGLARVAMQLGGGGGEG